MVLTAIGALLAVAQIIIAGFGAEESYDHRTCYQRTFYYNSCKSYTCHEVTAFTVLMNVSAIGPVSK